MCGGGTSSAQSKASSRKIGERIRLTWPGSRVSEKSASCMWFRPILKRVSAAIGGALRHLGVLSRKFRRRLRPRRKYRAGAGRRQLIAFYSRLLVRAYFCMRPMRAVRPAGHGPGKYILSAALGCHTSAASSLPDARISYRAGVFGARIENPAISRKRGL